MEPGVTQGTFADEGLAVKHQLEEMLNTFGTIGWRYVVKAAQDERENFLELLAYAEHDFEVFRIQGRISQLDALIGLEDVVNTLHTRAEADEENERADL